MTRRPKSQPRRPGKPKRRRLAKRLPRPMRPWPAAILGIDPGRKSGAALVVRGVPRVVRSATTAAELHDIAQLLVAHAQAERVPAVAVMETWQARGRMLGGAGAAAGLGESAGRWKTALELAGLPKSRVVRVYPQSWYAAVIGGQKRRGEKDRVRASLVARSPAYAELLADASDDDCEALAMALWGTLAPEVGLKLPKRDLRPHLEAMRILAAWQAEGAA